MTHEYVKTLSFRFLGRGTPVLTGAIVASLVAVAGSASGQAVEPAPAASGSAAVSAAPAASAAPVEAPKAAEPAAPPPAASAAAPAAPKPPEEPPAEAKKPKLNIGVGLRTGLTFSTEDGNDRATFRLYDGLVDQANIRPYFSGQFNEHFGFTANFETGTGKGLGIAVMDAIAQIRVVDEFQIWVGQHIPANDRNNMNGPFYHNGWNFPLRVQSYPFDVAARDRGVTFWGLVAKGMLKYHLSMVDLQPNQPASTARYAGRVTLHLLEPENFYYNSGTYFGEKDILAIGAVAQYQKGTGVLAAGDAAGDNQFSGFSFDALFEKNFGGAGTFTLEGGYWNFKGSGAGYVVNQGTVDIRTGFAGPVPGQSMMVSASWLTPEKIGFGKIQPMARFQWSETETPIGVVKGTTTDAGLTYVIDGFNHKYHLNYRHEEPGANLQAQDWIQIGAQYQMFN